VKHNFSKQFVKQSVQRVERLRQKSENPLLGSCRQWALRRKIRSNP